MASTMNSGGSIDLTMRRPLPYEIYILDDPTVIIGHVLVLNLLELVG